jgi:hypothetical protein
MLVPEVLEQQLKKAFEDLQPTIESELNTHFSAKMTGHTALGVNEDLDMGGIVETESVNSIYTVQEKTDKWAIENPAGEINSTILRAVYKDKLWTEVSKNWAKSLSEHISKDITMTMSKELAPALTEIITDYLKSATLQVIIPAKAITLGAGAASLPNPFPLELLLNPIIPEAIEALMIPIPSFGGIK